eukprot:COSAG01_NODE_17448_length_1150_cov_74.906755_1_plen_156_part_00
MDPYRGGNVRGCGINKIIMQRHLDLEGGVKVIPQTYYSIGSYLLLLWGGRYEGLGVQIICGIYVEVAIIRPVAHSAHHRFVSIYLVPGSWVASLVDAYSNKNRTTLLPVKGTHQSTHLLLLATEAENRLIGHPAPPQDECLTGWDVARHASHYPP